MNRARISAGYGSVAYLTVIAAATTVVAATAWVLHNRDLALGSAVLGLYALHLFSIRLLLQSQREHRSALDSQWDLLQRLVDPDASEVDVAPPTPRADPSPPQQGWLLDRHRPAARAVAPHAEPRSLAAVEPPPRPAPAAPGASNGRRDRAPRADAGSDPIAARRASLEPGDGAPPRAVPESGHAEREENRASLGSLAVGASGEVPIPRHFALGTVALIRRMLTPAEVAHVLMEQRKRPDSRFATLAVEMGLLTEPQREELLLAQQEGLFTEHEMREARERLHEFRESSARELAEFD